MKNKTSITLSEDLLDAVNRQSGDYKSRSDFIEAAVRAYIVSMERDARNEQDLSIINRRADSLNEEAADVLDYQVRLRNEESP
mgnify:CR=1 FL=1